LSLDSPDSGKFLIFLDSTFGVGCSIFAKVLDGYFPKLYLDLET